MYVTKNPNKKHSIYNQLRYWYHISTTLGDKHITLIPWDEDSSSNRGGLEPLGKRICVAPTIEQCITAIPYYLGSVCNIYRTKSKIKADAPNNVFDSKITHEGWLYDPTSFIKIGVLKFRDVEKELGISDVIDEAASLSDIKESKKVLQWWQQANIKKLIKKS